MHVNIPDQVKQGLKTIKLVPYLEQLILGSLVKKSIAPHLLVWLWPKTQGKYKIHSLIIIYLITTRN